MQGLARLWAVMQDRTWSCEVVQGRARSCKVVHGRARSCEVVRGRVRSCTFMHGRVWSCKVRQGRARPYKVVGSHARSCAVMRGHARSCFPSRGFCCVRSALNHQPYCVPEPAVTFPENICRVDLLLLWGLGHPPRPALNTRWPWEGPPMVPSLPRC